MRPIPRPANGPKRLPSLRAWIGAALLLAVAAAPARAHFLWLIAEPEGERAVAVRAFLSEQPIPDLPMFMKTIEGATYRAGGRTLEASRGEEAFLLPVPERASEVIDGVCPLGVMSRDGATFRIFYTARLQFGPLSADEPKREEFLRLRLVRDTDAEPFVAITFNGEPAAGAEVKAYLEDGTDKELKADENGRLRLPGVAEGRVGLLAKWGDGRPGDLEGEAFDETRYYATLTVAPQEVRQRLGSESESAGAAKAQTPRVVEMLEPLPDPTNSFGGAVVGDRLYVYGGHTGTTHRYHTGTTLPHFRRLNLKTGEAWEELPVGPAVQGVSLVAHEGLLYRVGGMAAHNAEGEPHDLKSIAEAARFDPKTNTWTELPELPEPRSTHDAAVVGDHLYVVGGWAMNGGGSTNAFFHDTLLRLDLNDPEAGWESLPAPFRRRALAAASFQGRLYVLGGLTEDSETVGEIDIFDPETETWSKGPELPGGRIVGFAPSAIASEGRLFVSGGDGVVHRLAEDGSAWKRLGRLALPRITHRLLAAPDGALLAVGGNFAGAPVRIVERFRPDANTDPDPDAPVIWSGAIPFGGEAVKGQAVAWHRGGVILAGGTTTWQPHAFQPQYLSDEIHHLLIGELRAEALEPLPTPVQSGEIVTVGTGRRRTHYLLGGFAQHEDVVKTVGLVHRFDAAEETWVASSATIPDNRGMFGAAVDGDNLWLFGGSIYDPTGEHTGSAKPVEVLRWETDQEGSTFEPTGHRIPKPRRSFAGAVLDRKYYMVGGIADPEDGLIEQVDVFDLETETWSALPGPERPRLFADLVELDGQLYLSGGVSKDEDGGHFQRNRSLERFDPETKTWTTVIEELPVPAEGARMLAVRGRLVVFGLDPDQPGLARFAVIAP